MTDLFAAPSAHDEDHSSYPPYLLPIAAKLSKQYEFRSEKKAGRTGMTYVIREKASGVSYCLKTILPTLTKDEDREAVRETLRKEHEILQPLSHRCVPTIFSSDLDGVLPFYICTFHPGLTWEEYRRSGKCLPVTDASHIIFTLIDAIKYLHNSRRTHCDLHLENLMLSERIYAEGIMIIDLGSGRRAFQP